MNNKTWMQEVYDRAASSYGDKGCQYFNEFGRELVGLANLRSGERILDIATGKGAVLLPASRAIGKTGKAIGIDLSPKMLEEAKKRDPQSSAEFLVMDAENLGFEANFFDVVFCGFALFFFPDPTMVFNEIKRVLKPKGRLAISSFGKSSFLSGWVLDRAKELGASKVFKIRSLDTVESVREILTDANFHQIEVQEKEETIWHHTPQDWWESLWTHGIRALLEQLAPSKLALLHKEALLHVKPFMKNGRVEEKIKVIFGVTRR